MVKFVALNNIVKSQEKCSPPCRTKRERLHSEIASRILHREFSITAILRFFIRNVTFRQRFELVIHNCQVATSATIDSISSNMIGRATLFFSVSAHCLADLHIL